MSEYNLFQAIKGVRPLDQTKNDLTAISDTDYTCRAGAIVPAGFERSIVSGGHNHHALFGGFFVSVALCAQLVGRVWEAHACRLPFTPVVQPTLGSPFLFERKKGGYINENGANTMANTPQKHLENKGKQQLELQHCVDKMDDLFYRIGFISSACAQSTDWIDAGAATELCLTVNNIQAELKAVTDRLEVARHLVTA